MNEFSRTSAQKNQNPAVAVISGDSYNERLRRKKPPPELITFWAELANFGRKAVPESMTPAYLRTPEELNARAKRSATMRSRKQESGKLRSTKETIKR
jgi:hypothetical protein